MGKNQVSYGSETVLTFMKCLIFCVIGVDMHMSFFIFGSCAFISYMYSIIDASLST